VGIAVCQGSHFNDSFTVGVRILLFLSVKKARFQHISNYVWSTDNCTTSISRTTFQRWPRQVFSIGDLQFLVV